jgi:hypothetical protein
LGEQFIVGAADGKTMKGTSKDNADDMKGAYIPIHKGEK